MDCPNASWTLEHCSQTSDCAVNSFHLDTSWWDCARTCWRTCAQLPAFNSLRPSYTCKHKQHVPWNCRLEPTVTAQWLGAAGTHTCICV